MPQTPDLSQRKILIVDDQESNVRLLDLALRRGGVAAVSATTDPRTVAALHAENHYDLILLDLRMPAMDGFAVLRALRSVAGGERVPILVLSADPSQMVQASEAGASGFLSKPYVLTDVLRCVRGQRFAGAEAVGDAAEQQLLGLFLPRAFLWVTR